IGHQWWWEVRYPDSGVVTANKLHLPVDRPVDLDVTSADVIHSFWVPRLGGKIGMIPGRHNRIRLQADLPGTFRGQCSEFCGTQHTHMILDVQAHAEEDFANWLQSRSDWQASALPGPARSEERRVGKEGRRPWRTSRSKEKEAKARKRLGRPSSPITSD